MPAPCPPRRPQAPYNLVVERALEEWAKHHDGHLPDCFVLAVRDYYRDSIGRPGVGDPGSFDDALFLIDYRAGAMTAWNGNTDPSRYGWNSTAGEDGEGGYMARLATGCWVFEKLIHRGKYQAFGQGPVKVTVERMKEDGTVANLDTGCFGINLHLGGANGTSSAGCLTVPPPQWGDFRATLNSLLKKYDKEDGFDLILIDGPII